MPEPASSEMRTTRRPVFGTVNSFGIGALKGFDVPQAFQYGTAPGPDAHSC